MAVVCASKFLHIARTSSHAHCRRVSESEPSMSHWMYSSGLSSKSSSSLSRSWRLGTTIACTIWRSVASSWNMAACIGLATMDVRKRIDVVASASNLGCAPTCVASPQIAVVKLGRCGWNSSSYLSAYRLTFSTTAACSFSIGPARSLSAAAARGSRSLYWTKPPIHSAMLSSKHSGMSCQLSE